MKQIRLSPTAIKAFKACPTRWRLRYIEGIKVVEDTDALRMGSSWHSLQEVYRNALLVTSDRDLSLGVAIDHLNKAYEQVPDNKDPLDWATERAILAYSFTGYVWYYQNDDFETLHTEIELTIPLVHPDTNMSLPIEDVVRIGKIDEVIIREGRILNREYKSTKSDIDPASDYWDKVRVDDQVTFYVLAARDSGISIDGTLYDVWKKPGIRPKMLSQADSKKFVETGEYQEVEFSVVLRRYGNYLVNGVETETKPGKKEGTFAIRETAEMYGARLLQAIYEAPEKYFQRREVPRTDTQLREFEAGLFSMYQAMQFMQRTGHYWKNEAQCDAPQQFKCDFCPICWHGKDVIGEDKPVPEGFRRSQALTIGVTDE